MKAEPGLGASAVGKLAGASGFSATTEGQRTARPPSAPPNLIETIRIEHDGTLPLLDGHLERLRRSCQALGHRWPGELEIRARVKQRATGLNVGRAWRLRLLLAPDGGLTLEHGPLETLRDPLHVIVAGPRASGASEWLRHKTTHRPWYQDATRWLAEHPDVFDILYWNENGEMCEGSRSNLYMQRSDGRWLTPPLESGALPGVQRNALLRAGRVEEAPISCDEFLQAPAWRISNALRGWRDAAQAQA